MPYKHWVGGSNPSATTIYFAGHGFPWPVLCFGAGVSGAVLAFCQLFAGYLPESCKVFATFVWVLAEVFRNLGGFSLSLCSIPLSFLAQIRR